MDKKTVTKSVQKKELTKTQAFIVMAIGGFMLLLSIVIPTENPSTAHTAKIIVGFLGGIGLVVGAHFRPGKTSENSKE